MVTNRKSLLSGMLLIGSLLSACSSVSNLTRSPASLSHDLGLRDYVNDAYVAKRSISDSLVRIEGGPFMMGSPEDGDEREVRGEDENQVHAAITRPFLMMKTEVTQLQWHLVMGYTRWPDYLTCYERDDRVLIDGISMCPNHPVVHVSWLEAQDFARKLNRLNGRRDCNGTPSDRSGCYRLPTEAEWEFAARGGTTTAYSFGTVSEFDDKVDEYAWYSRNGDGTTHPVGSKKPNPYGLYDVHGNVYEWVQDKYSDQLKGGENPFVDYADSSDRVYRGGSFYCGRENLRSAFRSHKREDDFDSNIGFRLVRVL